MRSDGRRARTSRRDWRKRYDGTARTDGGGWQSSTTIRATRPTTMRNTQIDKLILALSVAAALVVALPAPAAAQPMPGICHDGVLPSGALSRICVPDPGWNGDLVVFAHGYVAETGEPLAFHHLQLPDGTSGPDLVQSLGFAFATTSYRQNGLAILEGVQDIAELAASFAAATGHAPGRTILAGVS